MPALPLLPSMLQYSERTGEPGIVFYIVVLGFVVFVIAAMWRAFEKAGQPGWAAIVPIYNLIVMLRLAAKPWWWIFLLLIPVVNIIFALMMHAAIARNFGHGIGFALGLFFLGFIFWPILGFGDDRFQPVE